MSSAPIVERPISLAQLRPHDWAIITEVGAGQADLPRLMGMGICVGRRLQLLKGGDPLILRVYDSRIGLSARLARLVRVMAHADPSGDQG